jgi:hypothetical protein
MNEIRRNNFVCRYGFVAALLLSTISLKADPIEVGESPPSLGTLIPITLAILIEAVCILSILRRSRRPRLLIFWLLGMHALTYPLFLGWLWFSYGLHPVLAVAIGEGAIVLIEGSLIYLICRFLSFDKSELPSPSISKSLFASLIGNICSAVAFPLLMMLYGHIFNTIEN